jgi:hypothetical protein
MFYHFLKDAKARIYRQKKVAWGKEVRQGNPTNKGVGDCRGWTRQSLMDNIMTNVSDGVTGATDFFDGKGADAMIYPQVVTDVGSIILMTGCEQ